MSREKNGHVGGAEDALEYDQVVTQIDKRCWLLLFYFLFNVDLGKETKLSWGVIIF